MQDGEPALAGTARPVVARMSAATAAEAGVADGDKVTVATDRGSVTVPVEVVPMADHVVWLPAAGLPGGAPRSPRIPVTPNPRPGRAHHPGPARRGARRHGHAEEAGMMARGDAAARAGGARGQSHAERLQPAHLVDGAAQGRHRLPLPAADDHVHDLVRAPGHRPDAEPAGPEPGRPVRPAAADRRRAQAAAEGRHHPRWARTSWCSSSRRCCRRRPPSSASPSSRGARSLDLPPPHPAAAHRPAGGGAAGAGHELHRRVRHRAGRLGLRVALLAARRAALGGPGDQLRDRDGAGLRGRVPRRGLAVHHRDRQRPGARAGTRGCWRPRSSSTCSPWSARPTGCRSTCPRARASWWPATTPSTRR